MERGSFVFYRSFYEAVKDLDEKTFKACMTALIEYALDGTEKNVDGVAQMFLTMAKPNIDKNNQRYENGKRGGRPRKQIETKKEPNKNQNETELKPNENQTETNTKPYVDVDVYVDEDVNVNVDDKDIYKVKKSPYAPTLEDVKEFVAVKGLDINAEEFFNHYESQNWLLGNGNKITNWQAKVMTWKKDKNKEIGMPDFLIKQKNNVYAETSKPNSETINRIKEKMKND